MVSVKLKRLEQHAVVPRYQSSNASGLDLAALEDTIIPSGGWRAVRTGLAIELPTGYEGQVRPRSGLAFKHGVTVVNAPGTIDADYRGEVKVALINHGSESYLVHAGERMAQLVICPVVSAEVIEVDELTATDRGGGGFGSTGRST
jgi:dUTP pyrophosphatase